MAVRRHSNALRAFAIGVALVLTASLSPAVFAGPAGAANSMVELQSALDAALPADEIAVIVSYQPNFRPARYRKAVENGEIESAAVQSDARHTRRRQIIRALRNSAAQGSAPIIELARAGAASEVHHLWLGNAVALHGTRELIWRLLAEPRVLEVHLDGVFSAPLATTALPAAPGWNITALGVPALWSQGFLGEGALIASLDTGVDATHPDLAGSFRGGTNSWYDPYGQHAVPHDSDGHGTQVMGLAVGGSAGGTAIGVAPSAKWIAAKIFDNLHNATESAIHLAYQWVMDPDGNPNTDDAPDVVINSWDIAGENSCKSQFQADIDALRAADIAVVYSAGNFGPNAATSVSPANNSRVTSVGSVDQNNLVSYFSSRGPSPCDGTVFPKVVAPGDGVHTSDIALLGTAQYVDVSGTSFSAPEVAGVMALLRAAVPAASAAETEAAVAVTARDIDAPGPDNNTGYGLVDAGAAYALLSHPIDDDHDGYSISTDCNDHDASVHPHAPEIGRDGIDQDCNGYDQTIDVKYAVYSHDGTKLKLRATSFMRANAALEIIGTGPLTWRPARRDWLYDGAAPEGAPSLITIKGVEGEVIVRPRPPSRR